jgi:hypothetical protein
VTLPDPTPGQTERLKTALIQKATRFLVMHNDPAGFGEITDFGAVLTRRDYITPEYLFGLQGTINTVDDLAALITPDDVIRNGLGADPTNFPADRLVDVQREIDAAADWIATYTGGAFGVA